MSSSQPIERPLAPWRPLQFSLRALLLAIAGLAALLALVNVVGAGWTLLVAFVVLLVAAHVAGNSLGTALRDRASDEHPLPPFDAPAGPVPRIGPQQLAERARLCRLTVGLFTAIGAGLGAWLGAAALAELHLRGLTDGGLAVGTFSAAVIGGFGGFLCSSFVLIVRRAWREAVVHRDPPVGSG